MVSIINFRTYADNPGDRYVAVQGGPITALDVPANTVTTLTIERAATPLPQTVVNYGWVPSDNALRLIAVELPNDSEMATTELIKLTFDNPTGDDETVTLSIDVLVGASRITV